MVMNKLKRLTPVTADLDRKNLKAGFLLIDLSDPAKVNVQNNGTSSGQPDRSASGGEKTSWPRESS